MSILAGLKIVNVEKTGGAKGEVDKTAIARRKFIEALHMQQQAVTATIRKEEFRPTKTVKGETKNKRFTPWFFKAVGTYYTYLRYGTGFLHINGGKSIEAGDKMEDLLRVYDTVEKAAMAGELDEMLTKAAAERGRRAKGAEAAPAAPAKKSAKK